MDDSTIGLIATLTFLALCFGLTIWAVTKKDPQIERLLNILEKGQPHDPK